MKRSDVQRQAAKEMDLENTTHNERSQSQKAIYCVNPFV